MSDLKEPFNLEKGWLLWAGIGLASALLAVALTGVAVSTFSGETPQREVRISFLASIVFFLGVTEIYMIFSVGGVNC